MVFKNKVLMVGYGSVARCVLPLLLEKVSIPCKNITVIDFVDKREELAPWTKRGIRYSRKRISPVNIKQVLSEHVSALGLIIFVVEH